MQRAHDNLNPRQTARRTLRAVVAIGLLGATLSLATLGMAAIAIPCFAPHAHPSRAAAAHEAAPVVVELNHEETAQKATGYLQQEPAGARTPSPLLDGPWGRALTSEDLAAILAEAAAERQALMP